MQIIMKKTAELKPYENNPRINDGAVDYVAESIERFGFKVPIVYGPDNVIVCGHTRLKAALQLGFEEVPCISAEDLTEQQIKAFRLADNKVGEIAEWDYEKLRIELEDLPEVVMTDLGFSSSDGIDMDDFFNEYEPEPKPKKVCTCPHCGEIFEKRG